MWRPQSITAQKYQYKDFCDTPTKFSIGLIRSLFLKLSALICVSPWFSVPASTLKISSRAIDLLHSIAPSQ
ncbi:MAG: hypothetical protein JGK24_29170 [Microcoleus sp. PH2017_29_MFU_D_A]|uniref:hypothetical protein n=1 Tax=unclassified Microcoleus TaxID=2642155 RepID=UPI001D60EBAA|nr:MULTISPECIES: hypothetical protein [unclassified Microcoleus]MCC3607185.1 hypothetical protein [Microcoleus sp. PH2017_29_MFU_D_A]MCC3638185.1 hypothetical protein [Microcoleus sp. PH2017_37_MFU_D_B]